MSVSNLPKGKRLPALAYADDIVLLAHSTENVQALFSQLERNARIVGLKVNMGAGKTERFCICGGILNNPEHIGCIVNSEGHQIPVVAAYKYLGTNTISWDAEWVSRKTKVWAAARSLRAVWKSRISRDAKVQLLKAVCEPILSYGSGCMLRTRKQYEAVDGLWGRLLRYALDLPPAFISRTAVPTSELYRGEFFMSAMLRARRVSLLGHVLRETVEGRVDHPVAWVMTFEPSTKWKRLAGGQRRTLQEIILRDSGRADMFDFGTKACNRQNCARMVQYVLETAQSECEQWRATRRNAPT